jgi:hypothetical protein
MSKFNILLIFPKQGSSQNKMASHEEIELMSLIHTFTRYFSEGQADAFSKELYPSKVNSSILEMKVKMDPHFCATKRISDKPD